MRLHRFYIGDDIKLEHSFWLHDTALLHQWVKVLRLSPGAEVVLFDGHSHDRLYEIEVLNLKEAQLKHVTDLQRTVPDTDVFLFWSLLKKDKNDWVLQKCTELGVKHFIPLLATRSEKTGFNVERAKKIVVEAAEQCGRSDIPSVREPVLVETAIETYQPKAELFVAEKSDSSHEFGTKPVGVFIGPEGGWSDAEMKLFDQKQIPHLSLSSFTLRAETASVAAAKHIVG